MRRSQIVILALAGLFQGSSAGFAADVAVSGSAVQGGGGACPPDQITCTECKGFIEELIQAQMESFQTEIKEVCMQVPNTVTTDLATGESSPAPEQCLEQGTKDLVTGGDKDIKGLREECVTAVNADSGNSDDIVVIGASLEKYKAATTMAAAESFKTQASGIVDNLGQKWGVVWEPTKNAATAATKTDSTPARLDLVNKVAADKKESKGVATNVIMGGSVIVLVSFAVLGVKKYRSQHARQPQVEMASDLEDIE